MIRLKVIVGCEFSGTVRDAFTARGHDAMSCDTLPGERPGKHYQGDILELLQKDRFDLGIFHFPCTKIALCGNSTYGKGMPKHHERVEAIAWTITAWDAAKRACTMAAFENPKNIMGAYIGKRTQAIQPYQFGHMERKETWLWLHNLQPLVEADNVYNEMMQLPKKERERIFFMSPGPERGKERSRFYTGIAEAFATQWGNEKAISIQNQLKLAI